LLLVRCGNARKNANAGVSPLRRFAAFGRDDASWGGGCADFGRDDASFVVLGYGESKSNGKCGGLSTAAAAPPPVEMTHLELVAKSV
jgi:hypothetical protein